MEELKNDIDIISIMKEYIKLVIKSSVNVVQILLDGLENYIVRGIYEERVDVEQVNQFILIISPLLLLTYFSLSLDVWDERIHFIEYGVLGVLISRAVNIRTFKEIIATCCLITLIGVVDEIIQWYLPNRVGDIRDVTMNSFGGLSGLWLGKFLYWEQHFVKRNS